MKRIAVTQRVDFISSYSEKRDALDQRWVEFLQTIKLSPIIIPNNIDYVKQLIENNSIDGILLTGGNSLAKYQGGAPERDKVEKILIQYACAKKIPLLGVCRGMQMIQDYFNNPLSKISGHVAKRQSLVVKEGFKLTKIIKNFKDVNSFNEYGSYNVNGDLSLVASSLDGVIMSIEHKHHKIFGVMWHSEREFPFNKNDQDMFKKIFETEK